MILWLALRRLLPLLAVFSLVLTPVTAPAAAARMHASMAPKHPAAAVGHHVMPGMGHAHMGHRDAASAETGMVQAGMDDMPCCPKADNPRPDRAKPDCAGACPLMALCLASITSLLPASVAVPTPAGTRVGLSWPRAAAFASVSGTPLPEPPRA